jgi:hypothetical protein
MDETSVNNSYTAGHFNFGCQFEVCECFVMGLLILSNWSGSPSGTTACFAVLNSWANVEAGDSPG